MKQKKSYMDRKNIISEDILTSFLKGLFKGMTRGFFSSAKPKTKNRLGSAVDDFNDGISGMWDAVNAELKSQGKPPKKKPKKLTVQDVIRDYGKK